MVIKGKNEDTEIKGIPIISEYKYLGILIDSKMNIKKHISLINTKLEEYNNREYVLNQYYFSVKSIVTIFTYFHRSRLMYGMPCFIEQKMNIENVEKSLMRTIKRMLKLTLYTNTKRLKLSLAIPDINLIKIGKELWIKSACAGEIMRKNLTRKK